MKLLLLSPVFLISGICFLTSCGKGGSLGSDYTVGVTDTKHWAGTIDGYAPGDATVGGILKHNWPVNYLRTKTDTSFAVMKIDGYDVKLFGFTMAFRGKDVALKTIKFDTTVVGKMDATLIYHYDLGSMTFISHRVDSFNNDAAQYYQENVNLHTL